MSFLQSLINSSAESIFEGSLQSQRISSRGIKAFDKPDFFTFFPKPGGCTIQDILLIELINVVKEESVQGMGGEYEVRRGVIAQILCEPS
jgi:hypothetical protein